MPDQQRILVADIGGTHCRLALAEVGADRFQLDALQVIPTAAMAGDAAAAIAAYHRAQGAPALAAISVCAAGPLQRDDDIRINLTNTGLTVSVAALTSALDVPRTLLVNDFSAVAACAPLLQEQDLRWHASTSAPLPVCAVLGAGTGLGVSAWLGGAQVLEGEGGHVALAPADDRDAAMLARLADQSGFTSAEDFCSGPGLARAYAALCAMDGVPVRAEDAAAVHARALAGDPLALEVRARFTAALGRVAGDLALTLGARSVLLAGGIVPGWQDAFDAAVFRAAFEAKGRYRAYLSHIPSATVIHPQPALLGLAALATT